MKIMSPYELKLKFGKSLNITDKSDVEKIRGLESEFKAAGFNTDKFESRTDRPFFGIWVTIEQAYGRDDTCEWHAVVRLKDILKSNLITEL